METLQLYKRERCKQAYKNYYAVNQEERLDLMNEVGVNGLVLFEYYLRMASIGDVDLSDDNSAKYFGWAPTTSRRWRRALINKGFVYISKCVDPNTKQTVVIYYLGKDQVQEYKAKLSLS